MACHAVRAWMAQTLDDKGWSANEWATAAGTTPTNITRLMAGDNKVPSVETVMKLAGVARSMPDLIGPKVDAPPVAEHPRFCPQCGYNLERVTPPRRKAATNE